MDLEMNSRPVSRGNSLFGRDEQVQLLNSIQKNDFPNFNRLIASGNVDLEHLYGVPTNKTCLDITCSDPKLHKFVKKLIECGVDVNRVNPNHSKAPIHFAIEKGDLTTIKLLMKADDFNINIKSSGNYTPLNFAIQQIKKNKTDFKRFEDIAELLLKEGADCNIPDNKNNLPISVAAKLNSENIVKFILQYCDNVDLDTYKDSDDQTAREIVRRKFPHIELPQDQTAIKIDENLLWSHLNNQNEEDFVNDFNRITDKTERDAMLKLHNGNQTFLQFSCCRGMEKVVATLLEGKADPNYTTSINEEPPVLYACKFGYYEILKLLESHESTSFEAFKGDSLLQIVIKNHRKSEDDRVDYDKCRHILLKTKKSMPDINYTDVKGNTALHYATKTGNRDVVLDILRSGAYIGSFNCFDNPPLVHMSSSTLREYLDECITANDEQPYDDKYEITLNYGLLVPPKISTKKRNDSDSKLLSNDDLEALRPETDVLLYMAKHPDLKSLLMHPIISSFLYLKWQRISCLFYANITFYVMFWISLMLYILHDSNKEEDRTDAIKATVVVTKCLTIAGVILLSLREVFQVIVSPAKYFKQLENWLELMLIAVTLSIFIERFDEHIRQQLCAVAILLSSAELILLIGNFPTLATNIEMLKTVSWNFLKFILWYFILIIAFALSFYTLFRNAKSKKASDESVAFDPNKSDDDEPDFFLDPGISLFKTFVMLTGEFDAASIDFDLFPVTSHIIFIIFVFSIPIVLFNLLNGLAVSDTQAIRANAELVGHISRVKLISYFEGIFLGDKNLYRNAAGKMQNSCCISPGHSCIEARLICIRPLAKRICLFPQFLPTAQISVKVNRNSIVEIGSIESKSYEARDMEMGGGCCNSCTEIKMDKAIMKAARNILSDKHEETSNHKMIQKMIQEFELKLESFVGRLHPSYKDEYTFNNAN